MNLAKALDLKAQLQRGGAVVEASAGTGKTYSIAVLVVKAIIETGIALENILIVTFTRDATAELRDRVRLFLSKARDAFENEDAVCDNDDIAHIVENAGNDRASFNLKKLRVERALSHIDEAPVYTIHAFCQKLLKEFSFETMTSPGLELSEDDSQFVNAAAVYTFRKFWYNEDPELIGQIMECRGEYLYSVEVIEKMLRERLNMPLARLLPEMPAIAALKAQLSEIAVQYRAALIAAGKMWTEKHEDILAVLDNFSILDGRTYRMGDIENYHSAFRTLAQNESSSTGGELTLLMRFHPEQLQSKLKKAHSGFVFSHPFFGLCEKIAKLGEDRMQALSTLALAIKKEMIATAHERYETEKQLYQKLTYNDLLVRLLRALQSKAGSDLAHKIALRFEVVLVDEFQDTDSLQYRIFEKLFPPEGRYFYCIGDPKQSIYSFRGADIHSYLDVASRMPHRFTLSKNYRSSAALINAVNQLFSHKGAFLTKGIGYEKVEGADSAGQIAHANTGPFMIRYLDFQGSGSKEKGIESVATDVVRTICGMIVSVYKGAGAQGEAAVKASDIAILTRTSSEAGVMWQKLSEAGIPATDISERSVFETYEMSEMYLLLASIADVRLDRIAAVLSSRLFGKSYDYVHGLENDLRGDFWLERFGSYRNTFRSAGFFALFERIASETSDTGEEIAQKSLKNQKRTKKSEAAGTILSLYERILPAPGGARTVTNYRHIAELLHSAAVLNRLDEQQLMNWAGQRMNAREKEAEQPVRLDRDGDVVKIMTLHKSKGLEFPIVFLPFCWTSKDRFSHKFINATYQYTNAGERCIDVRGSKEIDEEAKQKILDDSLAEEIRLLYVGMTRAKNSLIMSYCNYESAFQSTCAWLFSYPDIEEHSYSSFASYCKDRDMSELIRKRIAHNSDISFEIIETDGCEKAQLSHKKPEQFVFHECDRELLERDWAVGSFTKIERLTRYGEKDYDTFALPVSVTSTAGTSLAPGAKSGILLHSIFEGLDFCADETAMRDHIASCLCANSAGTVSQDEVYSLIQRTVSTPLNESFSLNMIPRAQTLRELEFYFPVDNALAFAQVLKGSKRYPNLADLNYENFHGFMKGFIDLVFMFAGRWYVVDWKSNWLGSEMSDYNTERVSREIRTHNYNLQYLIYTLALHRYLRGKVPGYSYQTHFGGVYYLFVRNVGENYGIHQDIPDYELIESLDRALSRGDLR